MAWIQRIVLVTGIVMALMVTFISPPKILIGGNGARISVATYCGVQPQLFGQYAEAAGLRGGYDMAMERYANCRQEAVIDTSLLAVYLAVILAAAGTLAYMTRPK